MFVGRSRHLCIGICLVSFIAISFFLTATDSYKTLHLALGLVGMHSTGVSIWAVTEFSYLSFEVCLSDVS